MILLDTNVFMYAAGRNHPNKKPCLDLLDRVARGKVEACIDAETLQEILHRYRALHEWEKGRLVYDFVRRIVPEVIAVTGEVLDRARSLLDSHRTLMARDGLHVAVCLEHDLDAICSYDRDFDRVRGLKRVDPQSVRRGGS